jgi:hypothetical protein
MGKPVGGTGRDDSQLRGIPLDDVQEVSRHVRALQHAVTMGRQHAYAEQLRLLMISEDVSRV